MIYLKIKSLLFLMTIFLFLPFFVFASELRIETTKAELGVSEEVTVSVFLYSSEPINAIEGRLLFVPEFLELKQISDGNSAVNFWLEKPYLESDSSIIFAGITPGGFSGVNNLLFSAVFVAKKTGPTTFNLADYKVLKNDGEGSEAEIMVSNAKINIRVGDSVIKKEKVIDNIIPEYFHSTISRDPLLFDNKWFIVFSTQDKGSGISRYEIKEYKFKRLSFLTKWRLANSPEVLRDQELQSYINVRAIDNAGNIRLTEIRPSQEGAWYEIFGFYSIIIITILIVFYFLIKVWRRKNN